MFKIIGKLAYKNFDKPYVLEDDFGTQRALTEEKYRELVNKGKVIDRTGEVVK